MPEIKTIKEHLIDLKKVILKIFIIFIVLFVFLFFLSEKIILFLINYFNLSLFVLSPLEFIKTQIFVSIYFSIAFLLPFFLIELFFFARNTIDTNIKKNFSLYFVASLFLALIGFVFGVFVFSKFSLIFFSDLPGQVLAMWGIYESINFIMLNGFAFSLTLQTIIIIPILVNLGLIDVNVIKKSRKTVILVSLFVSAMITPPDILTQLLMSLPLFLCLELGMLISKR